MTDRVLVHVDTQQPHHTRRNRDLRWKGRGRGAFKFPLVYLQCSEV